MSAREAVLDLQKRMGESIIGQEALIERMLLGLLADGHLLVEGLLGLAKTRAIKRLAHNLDAKLSRIQFTPDCCRLTSPARRSISAKAARASSSFNPARCLPTSCWPTR